MSSLPIPIPKAIKGGPNPPSFQDSEQSFDTDELPDIESPDNFSIIHPSCMNGTLLVPSFDLLAYKSDDDEYEKPIMAERISASYPPFYPRSNRWTKPDEGKTFPDNLFNDCGFHRYNKQYQPKRNLRKCSYVLAVTDPTQFMEKGAKLVMEGVYILKRNYNGSPTGETCATIGIAKKYIKELIDQNSPIYNKLRAIPELQDVPGIDTLSPYRMEGLKMMLKYMCFVYEREIILFNIEPKGTDPKNQIIYPCANLCIPGGGMETQDEQSFEKCGRREFWEETGFILSTNSEDHKLLTKQKFTFTDRQNMYFLYRLKTLYQ